MLFKVDPIFYIHRPLKGGEWLQKAPEGMIEWYKSFSQKNDIKLWLPEIVAYEVSRGLHEIQLKYPDSKGLQRFDSFREQIDYLPLTTNMWNRAARLWAEQKIKGTPNASEDNLDGDALLAAQAIEVNGIVITENTRHISKMVAANRWSEV